MISDPNIFEHVNIASVEPGRSEVAVEAKENEAGTRAQCSIGGAHRDAATVFPGVRPYAVSNISPTDVTCPPPGFAGPREDATSGCHQTGLACGTGDNFQARVANVPGGDVPGATPGTTRGTRVLQQDFDGSKKSGRSGPGDACAVNLNRPAQCGPASTHSTSDASGELTQPDYSPVPAGGRFNPSAGDQFPDPAVAIKEPLQPQAVPLVDGSCSVHHAAPRRDRLGLDAACVPGGDVSRGTHDTTRGTQVLQEKPIASMNDIRTATERLAAIQAFDALRTKQKLSIPKAARVVGFPYMTLYWWIQAFNKDGFDGLLPKRFKTGRKAKNKFAPQEAADVKALLLKTNDRESGGSVPEALRVAIKRELLVGEIAADILDRMATGRDPLTPTMRDQVRISEPTTESERGPQNAWLKYVQSPGSLHLTIDELTGLEREIEPGEKWTMDDGTINFVCCVPFTLPGNKCSENFGVMVGRFQFLLVVDHRSYFIPGFNYTARPRSSYRAEDLTATLATVCAEHGYPRAVVLERGVSAAKLLTETLRLLKVKIERASSPHQKVVEFVFDTIWTKLSLMPGQVGRFRGEEEEVNKLITSCRKGATDPRKYFPMLADVIKALHEANTEWNNHLVDSPQYGKWVPREFWDRCKGRHLRKLEPEQNWMFSPVITDPMVVRGHKVRKSVSMMEDYTEVFDFGAEFFREYQGALVKLYFNPFAPECMAMVELAEQYKGQKAGKILGYAEQFNRMTRFRRRALGYGADPDIGKDAARRHAQALRRSVVAIRSDGSAGAQTHEARNGVGSLQTATNIQPPALPPTLRQRAKGVSEDEFERQAARLHRDAQRAEAAQRPQFSDSE